jgi:hypothetical protein
LKILECWPHRASRPAKPAGDNNSTGRYYLMVNGAETLFNIAKLKEVGVINNKTTGQVPRGPSPSQAIILDRLGTVFTVTMTPMMTVTPTYGRSSTTVQ